MKPLVLVVGSINMDLIVRCRRLPVKGETVRGEDLQMAPGGKGSNQAVACSRLGAQVTMIGRVGEDDFGPRLRASLADNGVNVDCVRAGGEAPTGVALILLEEGGENRIVVMSGANARLGAEEVAVATDLLRQTRIVLMPLEVPLHVVTAVAAEARAAGVMCVLDAGPPTPAAADARLPALVDVISPNETEAEALTGVAVGDVEAARTAAVRLREMGARDVVLKMGEQGAYWLGDSGERHIPAYPVQPVDTTAAGDAFTACLAVSLAHGMDMPESIRRSNAAGALACLTLGAQPSMPTEEALEAFLREHGP